LVNKNVLSCLLKDGKEVNAVDAGRKTVPCTCDSHRKWSIHI